MVISPNERPPIIVAMSLVLLIGAPAQGAPPDARSITLQECLDLALRQNPDIIAASEELDGSEAGRASTRGMFGPKIKLEGNVLRWDQALPFDFPMPPQFASLGVNIPAMVLREQVTKSATASVTQPITPLWTIYEGYHLQDLGVDVARVREQMTRNDIAYQVTEAYYRLLQAQGLLQVSEKSVAQIEAQVRRARAFFDQGMVGENDVLRAELGLAAATQRQIQARGMLTMAGGRLATLLGMPADAELSPAGAPVEAGKIDDVNPTEVERQALANRPELQELAARTDQARGAVRLAWSRMLPMLAATASYTYSKGSMFQQEKSWFVGGVASWDIWEWGVTYYGVEQAKSGLARALAVRDKIENLIRLEAKGVVVSLTGAAEALDVAQRAVKQAEENYRIENKRYEAASSTTFDVLDAETLLTGARTQQQTALYDFFIARAALSRVMGEATPAPGAKL